MPELDPEVTLLFELVPELVVGLLTLVRLPVLAPGLSVLVLSVAVVELLLAALLEVVAV